MVFIKNNKHWIVPGILWATIMYALNIIALRLFTNQPIFTTKAILIGIPLWLIGGLVYGYIAYGRSAKSHKKKDTQD